MGDFPAGNSWCEPFKTWKNVRSFPFPRCPRLKLPLPDTRHSSARHRAQAYTFNSLGNLTITQARLILDGQQLLWTDQSDTQNHDSIVRPRAAASIEVLWTEPGGDVRTALLRLRELGYVFRRRGMHAMSLWPEWCVLRRFACDLNA